VRPAWREGRHFPEAECLPLLGYAHPGHGRPESLGAASAAARQAPSLQKQQSRLDAVAHAGRLHRSAMTPGPLDCQRKLAAGGAGADDSAHRQPLEGSG
jgi:hypothetical protein